MFKILFANWQRFWGNFRGLWGNLGGFGKKNIDNFALRSYSPHELGETARKMG